MSQRNYKDIRTASAVLADSHLKFRIGLARQRTQSYPLDSDEMPGGPCWIEGAPVNAPVKFANGEIKELRFAPMCSNLSFYALYATPVRFDLG